jgi:hypothetical protein
VRMLMEISHDVIKLLRVVNIGCALFAGAAAARHQTLIIWDWMGEPDWPWFPPGNVFSSSLPERYWSRRRQLIVLVLALLATIALHALLSWLYSLTATGPAAC